MIYFINLMQFDLYKEPRPPGNIETLKKIVHDPENNIVLSAPYEEWHPEKIKKVYKMLDIHYDQANVVLVLERLGYDAFPGWEELKPVLHDSWMRMTFLSEGQTENRNLDNDKFLFITGKPHKKQRIYTLYQIYKENLSSRCEWSFHYKANLDEAIKNNLPDMPMSEYNSFVSAMTRKLDDIEPTVQPDSLDFHRHVFKNSEQTYGRAAMSLVAETPCNPTSPKFISEKTWKAIKNYHPFVLICYKESYDYLESLGFDTFQYLVKHPKDKLVGSVEDIVHMSIENTTYMLDNIKENLDQVKHSIQHNFNTLEKVQHQYSINVPAAIEKLIFSMYSTTHKVNDTETYNKFWGLKHDS